MDIIDSAVRLPSRNSKSQLDDLLKQMDEWSISHAIIGPSEELTAVYNEEGNRRLIELMQTYPDRFSGLAVANPWYGEKAARVLESAFEDGLVGLYLHPSLQGFHLTDEIVDPLVEVCVAHDKTIYSHTGTPICSMPFQLAELARRHPQARFVMGHVAWSDFCAYDVIPAALQARNIFVETSCAGPSFVGRLISEIGAERVVFGSAYPRSRYRFEVNKITDLNLRSEALRKVMCENARALWSIGAR